MSSKQVQITTERLDLVLVRPFTISHGTSSHRTNALVRIGDSVGEGALPPYYPTSFEDVEQYVEKLDLAQFLGDAVKAPYRESSKGPYIDLESALRSLPPGPPAARAAVDMALFDLWGKSLAQPLFRLFGLSPNILRASSLALSIPENENVWRETLAPLAEAPFLKIKLGSGDPQYDIEVVRIARECYNGRLAVDANAGWSIPDTVELVPKLERYGLEFIEQPIGFEDVDDWHLLRRLLKQPEVQLIADESVHTADDVVALAGAADGVNLKLAKCGGIRQVRRLIEIARALDLTVMLGCMIESSIAVTAAAQLAPLADYLDLDGMVHLADDPYKGVAFNNGYLSLPVERAGLGVVSRRG